MANRPLAEDFNTLKSELLKELKRRSGNGSVYSHYFVLEETPDAAAGEKTTVQQ